MGKIKEDCIFCKIANKKEETNFFEESENFVCFADANPKVDGHLLVVPKNHYRNLLDLPSDLGGEMIELAKKVARKKLDQGAEGFNVAMNNFEAAGQVVKHCHLHLLPRKKEDDFNFGI